jgi:hypothetical protein
MPILISNTGLGGRLKVSGNTTGGFKARYGGVDADAQAFFSRVTTAGGTLTATEQTAVNTLVVSLKSVGIWTLMKAIYPMVGASAAACAQNLRSSSFTGTFSSGWSFASTGITANGSSTFMDTALTPSTSLSLTSGHISIYIRTDVDEAKCDFGTTNGAFGSTDEILLMSRYTGLGFVPVYTQYGGAVANSDSRGFYITNRNNSVTNTGGFKNNTKVANLAQFSAVLPPLPIAIGCQNATSKTRFASKQYAFASIGDGLTDSEASNFYTAVQAFQTSLSRQV